MPSKEKPVEKVPAKMKPRFDEIVAITDKACLQHLDDECAAMARTMTAALARKRPSPLSKGQPASWASGVIYAMARVNFLFDHSMKPSMRATDVAEACGVSQGTAYNKARAVEEALDLAPFHPDWCLPGRLDKNPLAWIIVVDGKPVDARWLPRDFQEALCELGIIPYVPASSRREEAE
jgi:hypothetical protein